MDEVVSPLLTTSLPASKLLSNTSDLGLVCDHSTGITFTNDICSWELFVLAFELLPHHLYALLHAALQNYNFVHDIIQSPATQRAFLQRLFLSPLLPQQLYVLINEAAHQELKSLLTYLLLTNASYLEQVEGPSFLEMLTVKRPQPSRLSSLIRHLNPAILTKELFDKLPQEAILSLLCSVTHFHQFTTQHIQWMLDALRPQDVLPFWLLYYAEMPNAIYMLAHFMQIAGGAMAEEYNKLPKKAQSNLLYKIVASLELFPLHLILEEANDEALLNLAIKKYLNGHQDPIHIKFISKLTKKLLSANTFSSSTLELLMHLQEDPLWADMNEETGFLINNYIKNEAQAGSTALFYYHDHLLINRMSQKILLRPKYPSPYKSLFSQLLVPVLSADHQIINLPPPKSHPLIEIMKATGINEIRAIDYYLIHYQGNPHTLTKIISNYIHFYAQQEPLTQQHKQVLHHIGTLMTRFEMTAPVKEVLHTVLLNYPQLYDEHLCYCLFLYDAPKTLQHFGRQGTKAGYSQVLRLCHFALKKLDINQHEEFIYHAVCATNEAQRELSFANEHGFFSWLIQRIKRCWLYGWTGFFSPNLPSYVLPLTHGKNNFTLQKNPLKKTSTPAVCQEFSLIVEDALKEKTIERLELLALLLQNWDRKKNPPNERACRFNLNLLIKELTDDVTNELFPLWLKKNQALLTNNYHRLLELELAEGQLNTVHILLSNDLYTGPYWKPLIQELSEQLPALTEKTASQPQEMQHSKTIEPVFAWAWNNPFHFFASTPNRTTERCMQDSKKIHKINNW